MPELPEIETVKRGIKTLEREKIVGVIIRNPKLRYLVDSNLNQILKNVKVESISRRAKYLIFDMSRSKVPQGHLIIHLGMSGSLTLADNCKPLKKHDHVDILFGNGNILRYNDPRRFGCIVFTNNLIDNSLLQHLGPEPLTPEFNAKYLLEKLNGKSSSIKQLIMDNAIVVGVGNIYACESLFLAKISPLRPGRSITKQEAGLLVKCIKEVLEQAIKLGGSSISDYKHADGSLGYFQNSHNVYGRSGKPCKTCNQNILEKRLGQRNSFYCTNCQK
ncbi:MAG: DNA-formamidopyrimidine glycosylase [Burkholderiales bacterium]|jgi:formamidopyrimidine-DNA glycosylase|nr:DNA-formamidopyrimidine glycosylase [Burkholderiales bacterium]